MSAPFIWIAIPLISSVILWMIRDQRATAFAGGGLAFILTLAAWLLPLDTIMSVGGFSFKIITTVQILGRHISLTAADQPILVFLYGATFLWFAASGAVVMSRRLVPNGLAIVALLVASLAVEPFLYAALLIEMAVLLAIPLLMSEKGTQSRGLLRFVTFQTLAMPFILFSGWLLAGIEANPGNLTLVVQASIFLGLGFAFLLAIFPFHTWIPMLAEEAPPYTVSFVLWMFPTAILLFILGFLDRYAWLRGAPQLITILRFCGMLMLVSGGLFAALQQHLGRIFGFSVIAENGLSLLALSLGAKPGIQLFFFLLFSRAITMLLWGFSLTILRKAAPSLKFDDIRGMGKRWPFAAAGIVLAHLSLAGLPFLAGFPIRQALWEGLARQSTALAFWFLIGSLGLMLAAVRALAALAAAPEGAAWEGRENWPQRIFLSLGWIILFALGLFPQWTAAILAKLPSIFQHLGQ